MEKKDIDIKYFQYFVRRLRRIPPPKIHQFLKLPACFEQDIFRQKLATCIRLRVRLGSGKNKKEVPAGETFVTRAVMTIKKTFVCLSGSHTNCAERSLACYALLESFSTQFLSYGNYLSMVIEDRCKLESVMIKSLSA